MKRLYWVNSDDLTEIKRKAAAVRKAIGAELRRLQQGERPLNFRILNGFGPQVGELKRGGLRIVYTTECPDWTAVVCLFDKDAKEGNRMRPEHTRLIERRLRTLRALPISRARQSRLN